MEDVISGPVNDCSESYAAFYPVKENMQKMAASQKRVLPTYPEPDQGHLPLVSDFQPSALAPGEIHGACSHAASSKSLLFLLQGGRVLPSFPEELGEDCPRNAR